MRVFVLVVVCLWSHLTNAQSFHVLTRDAGAPAQGALDHRGHLWRPYASTSSDIDYIQRISADGVITRFRIPTEDANPVGMALGSDGNMWFAERDGNKIGRITPEGVISEYSLANASSPRGIAAGSDGNIWFTLYGSGKIGRISPAGVITEFDIPVSADPWGIAVGPDGNIYFSMYDRSALGRVTPSGVVSVIAISPATPRIDSVSALTIGPDGNLWLSRAVSSSSSQLFRVSLTGATTVFTLPVSTVNSITTGIDGNLWVSSGNRILVVSPSGTTTASLDIPIAGTSGAISAGPDGNPWLSLGTSIVRVNLAPAELHVATVFSSAQTESQSFLRFWNTGAATGTAAVTVRDSASGETLGTWTSPSIPAGAEVQYSIGQIESALPSGARPNFYTLGLASQFQGYFQHVLWRAADGTLTNLSTCRTGVGIFRKQLAGVHSSRLTGYESSVIVSNARPLAASVVLGLYDARDGTKLGTAALPVLAANGERSYAVSQLEALAGVTPGSNVLHYVIKAEGTFWGHLQHTVFNQAAGVLTDMTTACALDTTSTAQQDETVSVSLPSSIASIAKVAPSPDGAVWAASGSSPQLVHITATGVPSTIALPVSALLRPRDIAVDNSGNAWTLLGSGSDTMTRTTSQGVTSAVASVGADDQVAANADGSIWFSLRTNGIARIGPAGETTRYATLPASPMRSVTGLVGTGDGTVWFTEQASSFSFSANRIATSGSITQFSFTGGASPQNLAGGPDGSLWYIDTDAVIFRVAASGVRTMIEDLEPTLTGLSGDGNGNFWFARQLSSSWTLGRFNINGSFHTLSLPSDWSHINHIAFGADGNLWLTYGQTTPRVGMRYNPAAGLRVGSVFPTQTDGSESFLRLSNEGTTTGTARVTLYDPSSGKTVGQWSTSLAPGRAVQAPMSELENVVPPADRVARYGIAIETDAVGRFQHVLWRRSDGTLTNLSTCSEGIDNQARTLIGVHSSLFSSGFPSTLAVFNAGPAATQVRLGIFNAATGERLGTFITAPIPPRGQAITSVVDVEAQIGRTPTAGMFHYTVVAESEFAGHVQHILDNRAAGVISDMTTSCRFR